MNCENAVISLWLGLQPLEKRLHSSIGMISPIDYELAHQDDPDTEDPDTEDPDTEDPDTEDPDTEDPDAEDPDAEVA